MLLRKKKEDSSHINVFFMWRWELVIPWSVSPPLHRWVALPAFTPAGGFRQQSPAHSACRQSGCTTTMTDSGPKFKMLRFLKIIIITLLITALVLCTIASMRTLSLDVHLGLQLARWEKTNNISLAIDQRQREELLNNFKGFLRLFLFYTR